MVVVFEFEDLTMKKNVKTNTFKSSASGDVGA